LAQEDLSTYLTLFMLLWLSWILHLLFIITLAGFPIIMWGFVASYLDGRGMSASFFMRGILIGGATLLPILYFDTIIFAFPFPLYNILTTLDTLTNSQYSRTLSSTSLAVGLFSLALVVFTIGSVFLWRYETWSARATRYTMWFRYAFCTSLLGVGVWLVWSVIIASSFMGGALVSSSLRYSCLSFAEESIKHSGALGALRCGSTSSASLTSDQFLLTAMVVALGFAGVENTLYGFMHARTSISDGMVIILIRSFFSVLLHVACSVWIAGAWITSLRTLPHNTSSGMLYGSFVAHTAGALSLHMLYNLGLEKMGGGALVLGGGVSYLVLTGWFYARSPASLSPNTTSSGLLASIKA
jgi:hypothetical protein